MKRVGVLGKDRLPTTIKDSTAVRKADDNNSMHMEISR
jgi:hypothetical protein